MKRWGALLLLSTQLACSSESSDASSDSSMGEAGSDAPVCKADATQSVCAAGDVDGYWTACLDPTAFPIDCQQFTQAHSECSNCLAALYQRCGPGTEHDVFVAAGKSACESS